MLQPNLNRLYKDIRYTVDESAQTVTASAIYRGEPVTETETLFELLQGGPFEFAPDAARFVCEWYPEYIHAAADHCYFFPYSWQTFAVMDESGVNDYLQYMLSDAFPREPFEGLEAYRERLESEYCERYGNIIRDVAFSGVIVIGE